MVSHTVGVVVVVVAVSGLRWQALRSRVAVIPTINKDFSMLIGRKFKAKMSGIEVCYTNFGLRPKVEGISPAIGWQAIALQRRPHVEMSGQIIMSFRTDPDNYRESVRKLSFL